MSTLIHCNSFQLINDYNITLKNHYHALNRTISRAQINFLIYLSTFTPPIIPRDLIKRMNITGCGVNYFLCTQIHHGYITRIRKGEYKLSDKGIQFIDQFNRDLSARNSLPFRWK